MHNIKNLWNFIQSGQMPKSMQKKWSGLIIELDQRHSVSSLASFARKGSLKASQELHERAKKFTENKAINKNTPNLGRCTWPEICHANAIRWRKINTNATFAIAYQTGINFEYGPWLRSSCLEIWAGNEPKLWRHSRDRAGTYSLRLWIYSDRKSVV